MVAKHDDALEVARGVVRPITTVLLLPPTTFFVYLQMTTHVPVPLEWWAFVTLVYGWWYYDRHQAMKQKAKEDV